MSNIEVSAKWVEDVKRERTQMLKLLSAALSALRSYQYGNAAPDLAKEVADTIEKALRP
jgi:hypothetical protein